MMGIWRRNLGYGGATGQGRDAGVRSGMALIEIVGVIGVTAMLFAVVMGLFTAAYRVEASWREEAAQSREFQRLKAYFRHDAHRADRFEIAEDGTAWSLLLPGDHRVHYALMGGAVERIERSTPDGMSTRSWRQELSLPESASVTVQEASLAGRRLATLTVAVREKGGSRPTVFRVDASIGRAAATTSALATPQGSP